MSLNIMDSLLDKLSLASKDKNIPFGKRFTGAQNFLGTNNYLSQSIPTEFQQAFMDDEYFTLAHNKMNRSSSLDSKMNMFHYFQSTHKLVSKVSKLFSPPMITTQDSFRVVPNYLEILQEQELFMNRRFKMFCEEMEQRIEKFGKEVDSNIEALNPASQVSISSVESPYKQNKVLNPDLKDTCHHPNMSSSVESPCKQSKVSNPDSIDTFDQSNLSSAAKSSSIEIVQGMTIVPLVTVVLQEGEKQLAINNHTMNEKLSNRKNKKLQKRSKKRRRRQKKNNTVPGKCVTNLENTKLNDGNKVHVSASLTNSTTTPPDNRDILCDIVTIADSASSVQILLPNSSSFLIAIESADDDSDWDSNSDCEWLTDCSEFELSGIFISNLSAPLTTVSSKMCISQLGIPSSHSEEVEVRRLGAALRRVNKNWIEAMKGLDTKPRVATKVSFAPDDELVEVVHVDVYERKGEWETYATERMRFKRRIDELGKIISPCLLKEHRENVFLRFQESDL